MDFKRILIQALKKKYRDLFKVVQPIPFIRDKVHCLHGVFVEGGLQFFLASWVMLDSYHHVFREPMVASKRRIILGDPGYGKSTLTLQYAFDWCEGVKESYLKHVEILILLRLRQLRNVKCIYKAIRRFLLSKDCGLTEDDIENVLKSASSVVLILDGFDEYPYLLGNSRTQADVMKIITGNMFPEFEVILTSRCLPQEYTRETKRLRLTGFDDKAREEYIKKALVNGDEKVAKELTRRLRANPVLGDLCQVPLLFVLFAHISHENDKFHTVTTATGFFQYMIKCFHYHMKNKMEEENVQRYHTFEDNHGELDEEAFNGLQKVDQQIIWKQEILCDKLGEDFYRQYLRVGILVEEDGTSDVNEPGSPSDQNPKEVRFYHKLFCEWYAAHHIAKCAERMDVDDLKCLLEHMDPHDLHHCYRFACGLKPAIASKIIEVLRAKQECEQFTALCILEKGGGIDDISDTVRAMCSGTINVNSDDTNLSQRSVVQLLHVAASHQIPITGVYLQNCFKEVDLTDGEYLQLKSDVSFPVLNTLQKLWIREEGRELTSEEFNLVLRYASKCPSLEKLWFGFCLLPRFARSQSAFTTRKFEVVWKPFVNSPLYVLRLDTGAWKTSYDMTDEQYQDAETEVRSRWRCREIEDRKRST